MRGFVFSLLLHLSLVLLFWGSTVRTERFVFPESVYKVVLLPDIPPEARPPKPEPAEAPPAPPVTPVPAPRREPEPEPFREPAVSLAERLQARLRTEVSPAEREPLPDVVPERRPAVVPRVERPAPPVYERSEPDTAEEVAVEVASDFREDWYLNLLVRRLQEGWQMMQEKEGISLVKREVHIAFNIDRRGRISNITSVRASGNLVFDRSAVSAVEFSSPMPPLPASWHRNTLQVRVRFRET